MSKTGQDDSALRSHLEHRALSISKWGNLFMGAAGILAAWVSHSQAILVDGLFSGIGFLAAILAARVARSADRPADDRRPLGYAADESIYKVFRALSLIGLVTFASANAVLTIVAYFNGDPLPELLYAPMVLYFVLIALVCLGLAATHHFAWKATGSRSDLLQMEFKAALFDGIVTVAAGAGLLILPLLRDTQVGFLTPIGDSVIVLLLCALVVGRYLNDFKAGLGELAGTAASKDIETKARSIMDQAVARTGGALVDLSVLKVGRTYQVIAYFDPDAPVSAARIDQMTRDGEAEISRVLGPATVIILVSEHGRNLGPAAPAATGPPPV